MTRRWISEIVYRILLAGALALLIVCLPAAWQTWDVTHSPWRTVQVFGQMTAMAFGLI